MPDNEESNDAPMVESERDSRRLLAQVLDLLRELLGPGWTVVELPQPGHVRRGDAVIDARVQIAPPDGHSPYTELLVIAQQAVTPRDVETRIRQIGNIMRHADLRQTLLVASPWIGSRAQQKLREYGIAYVDTTGNVSISITYPSIRIYTQGAAKAPHPPVVDASKSRNVTLAGPRAGRIVRFLADFRPPFRAKEIADVTGVSLAWVSRLLGQLEDQLLIRREGRRIAQVNWVDLLRLRAETYSLLKANSYVRAVALNGAESVLAELQEVWIPGRNSSRIAITGSYAARRIAPLTVGGQLMLYVDDGMHTSDEWLEKFGLLRVGDGGDVLLLRAYDEVVFERVRIIDGLPHVALSQVVLDGLGGPGRMPVEAEQVLARMINGESDWRHSWSLDRG